MQSALKGRRVHGAAVIIKNATEELKRLSQNRSRTVFNTFTFAGRSIYLPKGGYFEAILA